MWGVEVGITPGRVKRWRDRHRAHTLQRSEARSRGSVASTVGRVQRFKDSIAQARFTGETKKAAQRFSAIGRLGNRCGMRQDGN